MADDWNTTIINEFRANEGRLSGQFEGAPMVLLTTTGAKTGNPRTSPMMYLPDEANPDRVFVFASKAGAPTNPDWYHNLVANPTVTVERAAETYEAIEKPTTRVIPVIALSRK
jgi:deazaflavin-dependent oxidoreductase (nitroreductase family)